MGAGQKFERYEMLDALRGLAALVVVLIHARSLRPLTGIQNGFLAVDLFFVLSGFVLARIYEPRLRAGMTRGAFLRARVLRLYPAYCLGVIVSFLVPLVVVADTGDMAPLLDHVRAALLELWLVPALPATGDLYQTVPVAWSLLFEMIASMLFVFLRPSTTPRRLVAFVVFAMAGLAASTAVFDDVDRGWNAWPSHVLIGALRTAASFGAGLLIAQMGALRPGRLPVAVACVGLALLVAVFWYLPSSGRAWTNWASIALPIPLAVALCAGVAVPAPLRPVTGWLGAMSYPLYLLHMPFLLTLQEVVAGHPALGASEAGVCIALVVTTVMISSFVPRLWEAPLRGRLASFFDAGARFRRKAIRPA